MFRIPDTAPLLNSRRTGVAVAACLAMTALVSACGGGDRVKAFVPQQIIAFGDENSAFDDTADSGTPLVASLGVPIRGARYSINVVRTAGFYCSNNPAVATDCTAITDPTILNGVYQPTGPGTFNNTLLTPAIPKVNQVEVGEFSLDPANTVVYRTTDRIYDCSPGFSAFTGNWVQLFAHDFGNGLSFGGNAGCPQDAGNGRSYATWGAKVDDVRTQFNAHRGELRDGVLVTMLAGQNDIMAAFATYRATDKAAGLVLMRTKGAQLGGIINDIVATGARVVYLTVPNMGLAPAAAADPTYARDLTKAFNSGYEEAGGLELTVQTNGHKIVKVDGFTQINNVAASGAYVTASGACQTDPALVKTPDGQALSAAIPAVSSDADLKAKALLLNCTSNNLVVVTPATATTEEVRAYFGNYLWADDSHLTPIGHSNLAALAIARVRDQL